MRLLHAGFRDVAVGHVPEAGGKTCNALPDRRRLVRQPVPLHRLPPDHRRRPTDDRIAARRIRPQCIGRSAARAAT
uniref:Uncharacterized protein n=1 Tax=Tanacetum cinerariifolium TaxID=118510 RepID=A0A699WYD7_TANCI|nr:hypothetical protein [Tanacetum cinerariifolium]